MDISIFLARVLGLYLVIISVPLLLNFYYLETALSEVLQDKANNFVVSIMTLIIGILLIVSHNIWVFDWRLIITLLGWTTFIKGLLNFYYPPALRKLSSKLLNDKIYIGYGICCAIIGCILLYFGFSRVVLLNNFS